MSVTGRAPNDDDHAIMWSLYVDYRRSAVIDTYAICRGICQQCECMYTSAFGDIIDCFEFIWGIYTDIVVSCTQEVIGICAISMAFEGHICCSYMYVYPMENNSCSLVGGSDIYVQ